MSSSDKNGGYRGYVQPYLLNTLPLQGPRGVPGFDGSDGYIGNQGFVGKNGRLGENGLVGSEGDLGSTGFNGEAGFQGLVGFEGPVGGFIENPVSTGMIFRINPVSGKFSNKLFYPDFELFESRLATP
ncbi:MAG: hypothetical protein WD512_02345, partial [Candidatus Paceibacterota bacterium]